MEIKKFNDVLVELDGVLIKANSLDRLFELEKELEAINDDVAHHAIEIGALKALNFLSDENEEKISKMVIGEEIKIFEGSNCYLIKRISKNFYQSERIKIKTLEKPLLKEPYMEKKKKIIKC